MSLNIKLMEEDLSNLIYDLKEAKAPQRQIRRAEKAQQAVLQLMYCLKPDCPYCMKILKRKGDNGR